MSIQTIQQFAIACVSLTNEEIYELFEDSISQDLRDSIYNTYSDETAIEPMRQAMNRIGQLFKVDSLANY